MEFRQILPREIEIWYKTDFSQAFAENERKPLQDILALAAQGRYELWGLFDGESMVGYATLWKREGVPLVLLDYLGVSAAARGGGLGAGILERLRARGAPLVVESELPVAGDTAETNALRLRRIAFYRRNGFVPSYEMATCGMRWQALLANTEGMETAEIMAWHRVLYGPERTDVKVPLGPDETPEMPYWMKNPAKEDTMRIGLAAYEFKNGDMAFNLAQIERAVAQVQGKADLLCFGESFLQGFDALNWQYEHDRAVAVTQDSAVMRYLKALTARCGVDLLFGYTERDGERLYSSCAVLSGGAMLHNYRRISRGWKEYDKTDGHYCEGTSTEPFLYKGRTLRIALCGDLWDYPERFAGDDLLIWPVYMSFDPQEWPTFVQEYAQQAKLAARETLMVNSITRDFSAFGGAFRFVDGQAAERLDFGREDVLIVEV